MKYKIITVSIIVVMMVSTLMIQGVDVKKARYHQHLEARPKPVCTEHSSEVFCTHLPILSITTDGPIPSPYVVDEQGNRVLDQHNKSIPNNETVSAMIKYFDNPVKNNHLEDRPTIYEKATIRIRGRSSRSFDKKSYAISFKGEDGIKNKKVSLSGMAEESNWVLHGPYMDKTLIRNYMAYNLAGEIMDYAPNVRFCEVFINGEYRGVYLITEKIEYSDDARIAVTKTDPDLISTSYIIRLDEGAEEEQYNLNTFSEYTNRNGAYERRSKKMELLYPSSTLTKDQKKWIEDDLSRIEKTLASLDFNHKKYGYSSFIDIESFVKYFILSEFTVNSDAGRLSTYAYKDIRGKMGMVVWDFNNAFNNYAKAMPVTQDFMMTNKFWYKYLLKDQAFVENIIHTYRALRKTYLSDAYLINYIDETIQYLGKAVERNNERWGYAYEEPYDLLLEKERNPRSYDEAVKQLKETIRARGAYLDENIETLRAYAHYSTNKQFKHSVGE